MKHTAVVFKTNGIVATCDIRGSVDIHDIVGGYFEIAVASYIDGWALYANETGRCDMLPMNEPARRFIAGHLQTEYKNVLSMHGDMVMVGTNPEGGTTDLSEEMASLVLRHHMYDEGEITITTFD